MVSHDLKAKVAAVTFAGLFAGVLLAGCTSVSPPAGSARGATGTPALWSATIDPTAIPLGDGKVSAEPKVGYLDSCKTSFGGRGAAHGGPWINAATGTWNATSKAHVEGANTWPQANYTETVDAGTRRITADDLPTTQATGNFPISPSDPAYQYDRNPNQVVKKVIDLSVPAEPTAAADVSCVPMGAIGVLKNGVYLFNAIDAAGDDAAAHETQDVCDGHPDGQDFYHYHDIPSCLLDAAGTAADGTPDANTSTLVGYALDGYGIYVERDSPGNLPTDADLDPCHGRTSAVMFNGTEQTIYHYSATREFPYTVGCFHGTAVAQPSHTN